MKTSNHFNNKVMQNFEKFFDKPLINRIGKCSGFTSRKAQKITAYHFVAAFIICCCKQLNTFSSWAAQIELLTGQSTSKQAVFKRLYYGKGSLAFIETLLKRVIIEQSRPLVSGKLFKGFGKVLLQDSTTLRLIDKLSGSFKGNITNGEQKSQVRIQTILNIKTMRFVQFMLGSFTDNDQSAACQVLAHANAGDLIIRDLGYFSIEAFKTITNNHIHFLSRFRSGVLLFYPDGRSIKIRSLLKGKAILDMRVCIGNKKLPVRLVMLRLPKAVAAERVRRAKCHRDKNLNHSKEYYQLLSYAAYITSVDEQTWDGCQVAEAYKVRWHIEIVFKSWKSGGCMQGMLPENIDNEQRVRTTIYLFLLFICLLMDKIFLPLQQKIEKQRTQHISILKFITYMFNNFCDLMRLSIVKLNKALKYNCCYEKRNDRPHMAYLIYDSNN